MAGAGYKLFNTGDVLTAQQVNEYLQQQTVMAFADASARTTALASVLAEGMVSYLKDTNKVYVYDGSAWVEPGASLPSQTGNSGKYLTTDGTTASWGTISAGGMTLLSTTTLTGSSVTLNSISQTYKNLVLVVRNFRPSITDGLKMRINADSTSNRHIYEATTNGTNAGTAAPFSTTNVTIQDSNSTSVGYGLSYTEFFDYTNTATWKFGRMWSLTTDPTNTANYRCYNGYWAYNQTSAISSIYLYPASGTFSAGTALLYGVS